MSSHRYSGMGSFMPTPIRIKSDSTLPRRPRKRESAASHAVDSGIKPGCRMPRRMSVGEMPTFSSANLYRLPCPAQMASQAEATKVVGLRRYGDRARRCVGELLQLARIRVGGSP